jgi:hypothetical protein
MLPFEGERLIAVLLVVNEVVTVGVEIMDPVRNVVDVVTVETTVVVKVLVKTDGVRRSIVDSS